MFLYEKDEVNFSPLKSPVKTGQEISSSEFILIAPFKALSVKTSYRALTFLSTTVPETSLPSFLSVAVNEPVISPSGLKSATEDVICTISPKCKAKLPFT